MGKHCNQPKESWKGFVEWNADITLSWADRLRVLCGCKIGVLNRVHTQWRGGDYSTGSILLIEAFGVKWKNRIQGFFRSIHAKFANKEKSQLENA